MFSLEVTSKSASDKIFILLVDDEPDFLELSKIYLNMEDPRLNFETCTTVEDALKMLENRKYDVVVSDYQMPGMDGLEFLEALRSQGSTIPFIIFTGRGREEVAIKALNLGADRYIQKGGDPRSQFGILAQAIVNEASRRRAEERLYESEKKFRAIVTQSQDGITLTNEAGEIIEWNDAQALLTQIPPSEALGQKIWDMQYMFAPDDIRTEGYYNHLKSITLNCLETGEAPWLNRLTDYAIESPDGTNRYMQQLPFSIKTQRGHMLCSITRDITELKKIEFNLKQSKTITDNLDEALLLLDMDGLASFANPTYEKITGYNISELIGKSGIELVKKTVVPHEVDKILEEFGKAVKGEELPPISTYLKHRNGKETPIEFTVSFVRDDKGNPIQIVAVIRDITERKQAEEKLRSFVDAATDPFLLFDSDLNIIDINETALKGLGLNRKDALGASILDITPDIKETDRYDNYMEVMKTGKPLVIKDFVPSSKFGEICVELKAFKVGDGLGLITRDITESKRAEEALQLSEEKLRNIIDSLPLGMHMYELKDDGKLVFSDANRAADEILGVDNNQFVGKPIEEAFPYSIETEIPERYRRAAELGEPYQIDQIEWGENQIKGAFEVHAFQTSPGKMAALFRDITEIKQAEQKLKESEERFRSIFDNANDGILLAELETREFLIGNKTIVNMLGYNPEELAKMKVEDIHPKDHLLFILKSFEKQSQGEISLSQNIPVKRKDGSIFYTDINSSKITFGGKNYLVGVFRDVTERKQAEERLQESEKKFRELVENINEVLYEIDKNGVVKYVSSPIESILEYKPSEITGRSFLDLVHPEDKQRTLTGVQNVMSGLFKPNEYRILTKSGDLRWILTSSKPVFEHNEVVGLRGVLSDITGRKQREEELQKSEARYRRLFEESPISLWEEDFSDAKRFIDDLRLSGIEDFRKYFNEHPEAVTECASLIKILDVNQATLDLYGAKNKEELLGNLDKVFAAETYPAFKEELIALAENRNKIAIEAINKTLKGGTIYVDLGLNISSEEAENRALISIMDITDRKEAEEREEFLTTLLRHDLINKIHVVNGYLRLLKKSDLSEENKNIIDRAANACIECEQLLEKVGMLREIDQKEELTKVNLDIQIQKAIMKNLGKAKENQIEIEYEGVQFDVIGGPLLEELFQNLVENAIKHSECSKIKISSYRDDKATVVSVEDNGKGIDKEIREKFFDKTFFSKRKGIGTYIIKRIAENYGGSVSIKASKLGGARFVIRLKNA